MLYLTQCLHHAVQQVPQQAATLCEDRSHTWQQLGGRVARLAGGLRAQGVVADDRVALLALNSDRYLETYFSAWWAAAAIVPLNTRWNARENIYALNDCEPKVLMIDQHFRGQLAEILEQVSSINTVIYMGDDDLPAASIGYEALIEANAPTDDALRNGTDLAGIFYTGGTTGFPKGVMLSHTSLYMSSIGGVAGGFRLIDDYVFLHSAPMFHLADAGAVLAVTMVRGTHAIIPHFTPRATLAAIERWRVRHAVFVPSMVGMLLQEPEFDNYDLSSFSRISYGASPMPVALLKEAMRRLPAVEFIQGYGQTELSPLATVLLPEEHIVEGPGSERLASAGRALPHCDVEVVDEQLKVVANGNVGQVRVRGSNAMLGYWKLPELTASTIVDGWVLTGDAGYMDDEGYLFLVDRVKDMIVSGGENVYSVEVENAIMEHAAIVQCAVIGIPDPIWVEAVHAIVVCPPDSGLSEREIIAHCRSLIAGYKCPRSVDIRSEPLPLSGAGKVLKRELRSAILDNDK